MVHYTHKQETTEKETKMTRKELIQKATILKVEICKQNGGNANYDNWLHYMQKQSGAELKRIIANIESHLERKVVIC